MYDTQRRKKYDHNEEKHEKNNIIYIEYDKKTYVCLNI